MTARDHARPGRARHAAGDDEGSSVEAEIEQAKLEQARIGSRTAKDTRHAAKNARRASKDNRRAAGFGRLAATLGVVVASLTALGAATGLVTVIVKDRAAPSPGAAPPVQITIVEGAPAAPLPTAATSPSSAAASSTSATPRPGPSRTAAADAPARFSTPGDGDRVPLCTTITGTISRLSGNRSMWLLVRGVTPDESYYILRRISADDGRAWTETTKLTDPGNPVRLYDLVLVDVSAARTDHFAQQDRVDHYVTLTPEDRLIQQARLEVIDDKEC